MAQQSHEARPEDARDLIPEILEQKDPNVAGNDLCELIDEMMGPAPEAIALEVEEEVVRELRGEKAETPKKAGHMSESGAVDVLMNLAKALRDLRVQHAAITPENARKFEQYEEKASQKVYEANKSAIAVNESRRKMQDILKQSYGSFTSFDRRSEAG